MHRLTNPVRAYAWGSRSHIPSCCGLPGQRRARGGDVVRRPPGRPRPASRTAAGSTRSSESRPESAASGRGSVDAFGPRLPFLMKLLAAAEPLSLQVHPTSERARIRFAEQNAAGIPLDAPERSYQDASHKPELIYALTRFEGMAGFRDPAKTAADPAAARPALARRDRRPARGHPHAVPDAAGGRHRPARRCPGPSCTHRLQQLRAAAADGREARSHRPQPRRRPARRRAEQRRARERAGVRRRPPRSSTATPTTPASW